MSRPVASGNHDEAVATLVTAAASGDESAWTQLVRRYTPLVVAVIRSHGLDRTDAADVNQTVWLRLVEHLGRLRESHALPAWLVTTTRRECHRMLRLGRRTQPFDPHADPVDGRAGVFGLVEPSAPDEELLRAERQQALRDAFAQLPSRCQDLLAMLAQDPPASYREVGERLGMPVGSVGPTQARCLARLRSCPALAPYIRPSPGGTPGSGGERDGAVAARP
ncbi:sigma-70 family RNA polymerase sigma factor [Solwaraspora sp. WMMD406]|uniref:RNA polymerase sigma factor n=1 Tax=Solwaraspora sp. WMMD406 TaxID=3016095 RepID=UPI0024160C57|nr:sigma-70 family RNA polymerase sigma factor [Solwaraspora sp. WMMD406]MDG4764189.1 sigma-70 family RNA polymerase sigma factor [Solwaraspora sp. WMMD406]